MTTVLPEFSLNGKLALITGSTRGLGYFFAEALLAAGANIIVSGSNSHSVETAMRNLSMPQDRCHCYAIDVTKDEEVGSTIHRIEEEVGPLDILVNNAGINLRAPLEEFSEDDWKRIIETNLTGAWRVSKHVVQGMLARRRGKIINIASLMSFAARPGTSAYTVAKGGLASLTKSMAVEWTQHNIQCNAIAPGYFATDMTRQLMENEEFDKWVKLRTPAGRWGTPSELVGLLIFLASEASSFISGQIIYVDGGWTANL